MPSIVERISSNGIKSYQIKIRKKGIEVMRTFSQREDAELFAYYKEKLIENMKNFDVDLKDRLRISDLFELKKKTIDSNNIRELHDIENSMKRLISVLGNKFLSDISFDDWLDSAKTLADTDVFLGAKTNIGKRKMSLATLRKIFAHASACISHAKTKGINLENHPLKVIHCHINASNRT